MAKKEENKLTERITIRLPQGEKLKLDALANTLHSTSANVIRILMNSTNTLDDLIQTTGAYNDTVYKLFKDKEL